MQIYCFLVKWLVFPVISCDFCILCVCINSQKMSNSRIGIQFTDEHLKNMSLCQIGEKSSRFSGYYITPWGKFNSGKSASTNLVSIPTLSGWCKNSSRIISNKSLSASKYLQSLPESPLGKTYNDIGFSFLPV